MKLADAGREVYVMVGDGSYVMMAQDLVKGLPVDVALNAQGFGAHVVRASYVKELRDASVEAKAIDQAVVIHVPADRYEAVPSYDSWWEVPAAEVRESGVVQKALKEHEREAARRRWLT
ncbi:MAG TPA: hypothetical protein VND96_15655 [Candidatus Micrarchaeaceae archaeon]|nr:hypothetical protein [Candidatus Micrarchaeaceae archaeon]